MEKSFRVILQTYQKILKGMLTMVPQDNYRELKTRIARLRSFLCNNEGKKYIDFFDELLREHEFGAALHVVCDFFEESNLNQLSISILEEIERLHQSMSIEDECVTSLRAKLKKS